MSDYDTNVYYKPEASGLTIIGEIDPSEAYEFDTLVVWQHTDGRVFYASDSGCSCPTPFEGMTIESLTPITRESWDSFERDVHAHGGEYRAGRISYDDRRKLLDDTRAALERAE